MDDYYSLRRLADPSLNWGRAGLTRIRLARARAVREDRARDRCNELRDEIESRDVRQLVCEHDLAPIVRPFGRAERNDDDRIEKSSRDRPLNFAADQNSHIAPNAGAP